MRKHFLKIFTFIIFLLSPLVVNAAFGDVRYEVTDLSISNSNITFKGWAFIHKTNNFVEIDTTSGKKYGGQKILIQAFSSDGTLLESKAVDGSSSPNYNFYCELFYKTSNQCVKDNYKNYSFNGCDKNDLNSYCYYEDIAFNIGFNVSNWNVDNLSDIKFKIAVSNDDFESKMSSSSNKYYYDNNYYTMPEALSIFKATVTNTSNDYIIINEDSLGSSARVIATHGLLRSSTNTSSYFGYSSDNVSETGGDYSCSYINWTSGKNVFTFVSNSNYVDGKSSEPAKDRCEEFLDSLVNDNVKEKCTGSYDYAVSISSTGEFNGGGGCYIASPCTGDNCYTAIARGSHIKPSGVFSIKIINDKKCPVTNPLPSELKCNNSGTLSSECEELTINTSYGRAGVKIVETGTVSSVFTPGRVYNGGGFSFGIMYHNNIKWSYVNGYPGDAMHGEVNRIMNDKIKDYDSYIAGITISNLKLGDKSISSGMVKKCFSSSTNKNYYGNSGLTVNCVFTFPSSSIAYDGKVTYNTADSVVNINNKYYTLLDKFGDFDVSATISGMDRIKTSAAKSDSDSDSETDGVAWTGNWSDSIDGCEIHVYPVFHPNNYIYRPIDINNPFPNRNAGINWYNWYKISNNRERLENTYSDLDYTAILDNSTISNIKNNNKNNNYLDWEGIDVNTGKSSFVTEYVERRGDS